MKSILTLTLLCVLSYSLSAKEEHIVNFSTTSSLHFIENKGQVVDQFQQSRNDIQYSLHSDGLNIFIGCGTIHYQYSKTVNGLSEKDKELSMYRMDFTLANANKHAKVIAQQKQNGSAYYVRGNRAISAHAYDKIVYRDIYPNIDWVVYIKDNHLEYDFNIREGGDPEDIRIAYNGADKLTLNEDGSLTATTPMGSVTEGVPVSFAANGANVNTSFVLEGNLLHFKVDKYEGPLVIDPAITWSTYYGGTAQEVPGNVKGDGLGNIYICGGTFSATNIATTGAHQAVYGGGWNPARDAFLAKFNSAGTLVWATYMGEIADDVANKLDVDASGNIYVTGRTGSTVNIATPGSYQPTIGGNVDVFLAKFNSAGVLQWSTYYGGTGADVAVAIRCDASGNVYIGGYTNSYNAIGTTGCHQPAMGGYTDAFLAKFSGTGGLLWGTYYGGVHLENICTITTDIAGNVFVAGEAISPTNIATTGSYQENPAGIGYDAFLVKFNSVGVRQWGTYYGGPNNDGFYSICLDATGNIYAGGATSSSSGIASTGAYQTSLGGINGFADAMLVKFNSAGVRLWGTYYGGIYEEGISDITLNASGDIVLAGFSQSPGLVATQAAFQGTNGGLFDGLVAKFTPAGNLSWGSYLGGANNDRLVSVYTDATTNIYTLGYSLSGNLSTTGAHQVTNNGAQDVLVAKIADCPPPPQPAPISGSVLVCGGSNVTYSIPSVPGATSYGWTLPNGWTGTSTTNSITATAGPAGGTISVVAISGCGNGPAQTLTVSNAAPVGVITASATSICQGSNALLTTSTTGTGYSYQWQLNGADIPGATGTSYSATQGGNYTLAVTNSSGCEGSSNTITITIMLPPVATITINAVSTYICAGEYVSLSAPWGNNYVYQWLQNGITIPGSTNQYYVATVSGTYSVKVSQNGCADTSNGVTITVLPTPATPVLSNSGPVCAGDPVTLTASNVSIGTTFLWVGMTSGFVSTLQNPTVPSVQFSEGYTFTVTGSNGCEASAATYVTMTDPPVAPAAISGNNSVCPGSSQTYVTPGSLNATSYTWTLPTGWGGASASNIITTTVGTTSGNVTVVAENMCGSSAPVSFSVAVDELPSVPGAISGDISVCPGSNHTYVTAGSLNATTYIWTLPTGWVGTSLSDMIATVAGTTSGDVTVAAQNICGVSAPVSLYVDVLPLPVIVITQNGAVLEATTVLSDYQWYHNGTPIAGANSDNYTPTQSGDYYVTATLTSGGCPGVSNTLNVTIAVNASQLQKGINGVSVYPNPNDGFFTIRGTTDIQLREVNMEITDVVGRVLYSEYIAAENGVFEQQVKMDLPAGVYMATVTAGTRQTHIKFIKK